MAAIAATLTSMIIFAPLVFGEQPNFSVWSGYTGIAGFMYVTETPFNLMAKIGILVFIGIIVNEDIVLIDHINNLWGGGMVRSQATREGFRERFRPIVKTHQHDHCGLNALGIQPQ